MATLTLGTNATTTLTALVYSPAANNADVATISQLIQDDLNPAHPKWPGAWARTGLLYVPNRGVLRCLPGDYVAVDANGWPILVSKYSIAPTSPASSDWTHS